MLFNKSNSQADQNGRESKWAQEVCFIFILRLCLSQRLGPDLSLSQLANLRGDGAWGMGNHGVLGMKHCVEKDQHH